MKLIILIPILSLAACRTAPPDAFDQAISHLTAAIVMDEALQASPVAINHAITLNQPSAPTQPAQ